MLNLEQFVPGKAGRRFAISNPANDEVICDIHEALEEDVNLAIDAAQAAFEDWSSCNAGERAAFLTKFAHLIARDAEELAQLDAVALGKYVFGNSKFPVQVSILICNVQAGGAPEEVGYPYVCRSIHWVIRSKACTIVTTISTRISLVGWKTNKFQS